MDIILIDLILFCRKATSIRYFNFYFFGGGDGFMAAKIGLVRLLCQGAMEGKANFLFWLNLF